MREWELLFHVYARSNVFVCPSDKKKQVFKAPATFTDQNLSYFAAIDAQVLATNSGVRALAGDRHLEHRGVAVKPGLLVLAPGEPVGWTGEMHKTENSRRTVGVIAFADGHVEAKKDRFVPEPEHSAVTNRFAVP